MSDAVLHRGGGRGAGERGDVAHNLKCRGPTEAAGDVMRRDCHILETQMGAGRTTRGLFP